MPEYDAAVKKLLSQFKFSANGKKIVQEYFYLYGDKFFEEKLDKDGIPILNSIYIENSQAVWCKYCQRWHIHGMGDGHRLAHCTFGTGYTSGYNINTMYPLLVMKNKKMSIISF